MSLRLAFLGTPDFAVPVLNGLVAAGHDIAAVYSQPPRPARRGKKERPSAVHEAALDAGLQVRTPETLKEPKEQRDFAEMKLDAAIVVAYGQILPEAILTAPVHGCFNLHASLLPRWRGAAPIQRAIMAGDEKTGVCVMQMEQGLDTGPVCARAIVPIRADTTAGALHDRLAQEGAALMSQALAQLARDGQLPGQPQESDGITYAAKIDKAEARLDFSRPALDVVRQIHGLSPFPGAWFMAPDEGRQAVRVKLLQAETAAQSGPAGTVLDDRLTIACGSGAIRALVVQREGKGAMRAEDFLRGLPLKAGTMINTARPDT